MKEKVKETTTSKFYGVRQHSDKGNIYFRSGIKVHEKNVYLGIYKEESHAAYAFNVGFDYFNNNHFIIFNTPKITLEEKNEVFENVTRLLKSKKLI
jgi:hypothetical protein